VGSLIPRPATFIRSEARRVICVVRSRKPAPSKAEWNLLFSAAVHFPDGQLSDRNSKNWIDEYIGLFATFENCPKEEARLPTALSVALI